MPRYVDMSGWDSFMSDMLGSRSMYDQYDIGYTDAMYRVDDWIDEQPTIEAIPAEKLGQLGKLMLPYKGCPRGQTGRMGGATLEEEAFYMGVITDEDGGRWVPVNEDVLRELVEKASDRPHGRWVLREGAHPDGWEHHYCTRCDTAAVFWYLEDEDYDEGIDGEWRYIGLRESSIEEILYPYCPNCGAEMDEEEEI